MAVIVQASEVVDRPVAEVFHFYAHDHVRNHPRWDPDMQLEQISEGPLAVGTVIRRVNTHSGRPVEGLMKIVELEPNRSFAVEIEDSPVRTNGRVTFEPLNEGRTRITISAEFPDTDDPTLKDHLTPLVQRSTRNIKTLWSPEPRAIQPESAPDNSMEPTRPAAANRVQCRFQELAGRLISRPLGRNSLIDDLRIPRHALPKRGCGPVLVEVARRSFPGLGEVT